MTGGEVLAILFIVAVMTAATKSGRNFVREAWKATGWRTPRAAAQHHSGRLGSLAGRGVAAGARGSGKAAKFAGYGAAAGIGRWSKSDHYPFRLVWRGDSRDTTEGTDGGNAPQAAGPAAATTPAPASGPDNSGTGTVPAPANPQETAPSGTERKGRTSMANRTNRYVLNLERPTTDGEFLEDVVRIADVLKGLAENISEWASELSSLHLPKSVTGPLEQVSQGLTDAAAGAAQSAKAFEDEFEDARDVASRGMTITGQDAA